MKDNKKQLVFIAALAIILVLVLFFILSGCSANQAVCPKAGKQAASAMLSGKDDADKPEEAAQTTDGVENQGAENTDAAESDQPQNQAPTETEKKPEHNTNSNQNSGSNKQPSKHEHAWNPVYSTVHHEEVGHYENVEVKAVWDEPQYEYWEVCSACGAKFHGVDPVCNHIDDVHDGHGSYSTKQFVSGYIHHDAVYEQKWVVDTAAWDESVVTGYQCSCGATKGA